jgi:hypothetical protein
VPTPLTGSMPIRQCRVAGLVTPPKPRRIRPFCAIFRLVDDQAAEFGRRHRHWDSAVSSGSGPDDA